jgi:hypothetical protein
LPDKTLTANLSAEAMAAVRRGWYLGDDTFRDRLLGLVSIGNNLPDKITKILPAEGFWGR